MKIGKKLQLARIRENLTQKEIAEKMKISQGTYSRLERGIQEPTVYELMQLRIYLKISFDEYLDSISIKNHKG